MKSIIYSLIVFAGLSLASCGNAAENDNKAKADSAAMQAASDSMMNAAMNSTVADSGKTIASDSTAAKVDSAK